MTEFVGTTNKAARITGATEEFFQRDRERSAVNIYIFLREVGGFTPYAQGPIVP